MSELKRIADSLEAIEKGFNLYYSIPTHQQIDNGKFWKWAFNGRSYQLFDIKEPHLEPLSTLLGLQEEINAVKQNTQTFLEGKLANNVLLVGARGCGKSSILRGIFKKYYKKNLRVIETDIAGLAHNHLLQPLLNQRQEKFIFFCDDLSIDSKNSEKFNQLKKSIEGALSSTTKNVLVYATSNRRNILQDNFQDNLGRVSDDGDIQPQESIDDKVALVDRFGLRLFLQSPSMLQYEKIIAFYLEKMNIAVTPDILQKGRQFSDSRGSVNGRIARQFAISIAAGAGKGLGE